MFLFFSLLPDTSLAQVFIFLNLLPKFNHILNRCGAQQSGDLGPSSETIDGILGFGQGN